MLELVTFLEMGGTPHDVIVVPLLSPPAFAPLPRHAPPPVPPHGGESALPPDKPSPAPLNTLLPTEPSPTTSDVPVPLAPAPPSPDAPAARKGGGGAPSASSADIELQLAPPSARLPAPPAPACGRAAPPPLPSLPLATEGSCSRALPAAAPTAEELHVAWLAAIEPLTRFDVHTCACYCPNDFSVLLASIESAFGSHSHFNRKVRHIGAALLGEARASATGRGGCGVPAEVGPTLERGV